MIEGRFMQICEGIENNLRDMKTDDEDEFYALVEKFAMEKLMAEADIELAHVRVKQDRTCGFENCRDFPRCLKDLQ